MAMIPVAIVVTIVNLILLSILFAIYLKNYRSIKAKFNLGLIVFAGFLVIEKLITLYFLLTMMSKDDIIGTPMFVLEILQFFGFSSLVWITVK